MTFSEAIQSVTFKVLKFNGRSSRSEYNYWMLFTFILSLITASADVANNNSIASNLLGVSLILPGMSVACRRFHDLNKSFWNYLWVFTIIGAFVILYFLIFEKGTIGDNDFGSDPVKYDFIN